MQLRARVGDWLECRHSNADITGMGHNIDFHAVMGPGGGAPATYADTGEARSGLFKLTYPGLYVYHCAAAPLPAHVGNGMYGIISESPVTCHHQPGTRSVDAVTSLCVTMCAANR